MEVALRGFMTRVAEHLNICGETPNPTAGDRIEPLSPEEGEHLGNLSRGTIRSGSLCAGLLAEKRINAPPALEPWLDARNRPST